MQKLTIFIKKWNYFLKNIKYIYNILTYFFTINSMDYSKAGELLKLQQEAMKIKKELENTQIESEVDGLVVTINGEMKVEKVEFEDTRIIWDKAALEKAILEAVNKWMKKAQSVAADMMGWVMGQMGMWDFMNWALGSGK